MGSKNNSTWKENGWKDEMEKDLRIAVFGAAVITGTKNQEKELLRLEQCSDWH